MRFFIVGFAVSFVSLLVVDRILLAKGGSSNDTA